MDDALEWALRYVGMGWRVIPIAPRSKQPALKAWTESAADNPELVRNWWTGLYRNHGVGVVTGHQSGVWVLDVDPAHGGDQTLAALVAANGPIPFTYTVHTGGGGMHLYFCNPPGLRVVTGRGRLGPGLDVRGEGGQVVAPPTVHATGNPYRWGVSPWSLSHPQPTG